MCIGAGGEGEGGILYPMNYATNLNIIFKGNVFELPDNDHWELWLKMYKFLWWRTCVEALYFKWYEGVTIKEIGICGYLIQDGNIIIGWKIFP